MPDITSEWSTPVQFQSIVSTYPSMENQKLAEGRGFDYFGNAAAISDDKQFLLIGASSTSDDYTTDRGAIHTFIKVDGIFVSNNSMVPGDNASGDQFGHAIALTPNGQILAASSVNAPTSVARSGAVYVFQNASYSGWWNETYKIVPPMPTTDGRFGSAIAISADGTTLAIGEEAGGVSGRVHIFKADGASWVLEATLSGLADIASGGKYGASLDLSADGTVLAVGAPFDLHLGSYKGAVILHRKTGPSTWDAGIKILPSDDHNSARFGHDVKLTDSGDRLFVAAPYGDPTNTGSGYGSVYVYDYAASTWVGQRFSASDQEIGDYFGWSIDCSADGNTMIAGSYWNDDSGNASGSAYVFRYVGGNWTEYSKLTASDAAANDYFGEKVKLSNDGSVGIVSSLRNSQIATHAGAVYIFI